ncbi:acyl-CoA thioesterase [Pseudonocardia sp. T1-2H]|uniref:acyl-CoA thioesterase n=1 Tax=Pseudonocardia sp. T1-2H TaxID=3128899 RepID=UPI0031016DCF
MTHPPTHPPAEAVADPTLLDLLTLEPLERDLFRATTVFEEQWALYGGQVAAQALLAAGRTVDEDRSPHSLHGYYLRGGDASRPTLFRVYRDRDGRSFSARRVVAIQNGEVIFNMSASFHIAEEGLDRQFAPRSTPGTRASSRPSRRRGCSRWRAGCRSSRSRASSGRRGSGPGAPRSSRRTR